MIDGAKIFAPRGYTVTRIYIIDCEYCEEAVNPDDDHQRYFRVTIRDELKEHHKTFHPDIPVPLFWP